MTETDIIDALLAREGGWRDQVTRPNGSIDPPTNMGITLPTLRAWLLRTGHTASTDNVGEDDLRHLRPETAALIYQEMYIIDPGFTPANIPFEPLRVQLIDFGVNSGPERAVRWLQRVLGFGRASVDGKLGPNTISALRCWGSLVEPEMLEHHYRLVNDALVAARSYMIDQAVDQGAMRKQDEEGVESRALSFFLARP